MVVPDLEQQQSVLAAELRWQIESLYSGLIYYEDVRANVGRRDWSELGQWSALSNTYLRSQSLAVDQLTTIRPHRASLRRVIKYARANVDSLPKNGEDDDWESVLGRASMPSFTVDEADTDLKMLDRINVAILREGNLDLPDPTGARFRELVTQSGASPEFGFELPTFPELELAIDRLYDMWLKYAEIFYGSSFSRIRNFSRHIQIQTFEALVCDWQETQFDPDADD